jgi:hypothetical protein
MGEEYLQLSMLAPNRQHGVFYGRCAIDVLEVPTVLARSGSASAPCCLLPVPQHCVRVRRNRLGDHIDTLSASFALARALMFAGYLGEAEELAVDCERQAAALLHASARARVRVASMRAQLLEERGHLQEAESR